MAVFPEVLSPVQVAVATILAAVVGLAYLIVSRGRKRPTASSKLTESSVIHVKTNGHVASQEPGPAAPAKDRVLILYGTQTGTAERFAKSLRSQLEGRYGTDSWEYDVMDTENYQAEQLVNEKLVLLLMATYGDGEPTDDAVDFYDWLVATVEGGKSPNLFEGLAYGVFALGNRQYEHFCAVGQRLQGLLADLGGQSLLEPGLGDDDVDIDADFDAWTASLFTTLDAGGRLGAASAGDRPLDAASVEAFAVEDVEVEGGRALELEAAPASHGETFSAPVVEVRELHAAASDRSCIHVALDLSGSGLTYSAGDHVAVRPRNAASVVDAALKALGYDGDRVVRFGSTPRGEAPPFGGPVSVRDALALGADLLGPPSKAALAALAAHAADPAQAERLRRLAAPEGREDYHAYVVAAKRSLLEVLQEHGSARPGVGVFFASVADRLQPRYYSISSSPLADPERLTITCVAVEEWMPSGRLHRGVASTYLSRLRPGQDRVPVSIRRSSFRLPADPAAPIVMVGPGTGLAPFRGFLEEREARRRLGHGGALGPAILFFGCRREDTDFIYRDELERWVLDGTLTTLHVAFSRHGATKDYVQHHLQRHAAEVWEALGPEGGGTLYVCGDAAGMARDVHATLCTLAGDKLGGGLVAGEEWLKKLTAEGRCHRDIW